MTFQKKPLQVGPEVVQGGPDLVQPQIWICPGWTRSGPGWTRSGPGWTRTGPGLNLQLNKLTALWLTTLLLTTLWLTTFWIKTDWLQCMQKAQRNRAKTYFISLSKFSTKYLPNMLIFDNLIYLWLFIFFKMWDVALRLTLLIDEHTFLFFIHVAISALTSTIKIKCLIKHQFLNNQIFLVIQRLKFCKCLIFSGLLLVVIKCWNLK